MSTISYYNYDSSGENRKYTEPEIRSGNLKSLYVKYDGASNAVRWNDELTQYDDYDRGFSF